MTLEEIRTAVRDAVAERASDAGLISSEAELDRWINAANRTVFRKAIKKNADRWKERASDIAYVAPGPLDFSVIAGGDPLLAGPLAVAFGSSPVEHISLVRAKRSDGNYYPVTPFEQGEDHAEIEPVTATSGSFPFRWYVEGEALWLSPPPVVDQTLEVTFVRSLAVLAAGEHALAGRYPESHDVVVWKAAQLLYAKDEQRSTPWDAEWNESIRDLLASIARSQNQQTRRVRRRSHYRFSR